MQQECVPLAASSEAPADFSLHVVCELKLIFDLLHVLIQDFTSECHLRKMLPTASKIFLFHSDFFLSSSPR